jgi:hypothetical protein
MDLAAPAQAVSAPDGAPVTSAGAAGPHHADLEAVLKELQDLRDLLRG